MSFGPSNSTLLLRAVRVETLTATTSTMEFGVVGVTVVMVVVVVVVAVVTSFGTSRAAPDPQLRQTNGSLVESRFCHRLGSCTPTSHRHHRSIRHPASKHNSDAPNKHSSLQTFADFVGYWIVKSKLKGMKRLVPYCAAASLSSGSRAEIKLLSGSEPPVPVYEAVNSMTFSPPPPPTKSSSKPDWKPGRPSFGLRSCVRHTFSPNATSGFKRLLSAHDALGLQGFGE